MARASISAYSATQTSNTLITDDSTDISIAEGFPAANINDAIRTLMTHLADAYAGDSAYDSVTDTITAGTTQTQAGAVALCGQAAIPLHDLGVIGVLQAGGLPERPVRFCAGYQQRPGEGNTCRHPD